MTDRNVSVKDSSDRELVITRVLSAPCELVWKAWTDSKHVVKWWGPYGFTTTTSAMDVRPGGVWEFIMHGPDGRDYQNKIIFLEVVENQKLVYKHSGGEDMEPVNFHVTVTFESIGDKTRLTMRSVFESAEELQRVDREYGAIEGAKQHMERLEIYLSETILPNQPK